MKLHSQTWGDPEQPALVFLHGFLGDHSDWEELIPHLDDRYYCVAFDLPGHGRSQADMDHAAYTLPGAARLLRDELPALKDATVVGYSMGGRLALYLAIHHPEVASRFVMESASPGLLNPQDAAARLKSDQRWADRWRSEPMEAVLADWYRQPVFAGLADQGPVYERMLARRRQNRGARVARSMRGMSVAAQESLWDKLAGLTRDVRVLAGARDRKYRAVAELMAERSDRITVDLIPEAGHNAHLEAPTAFVAALSKFLNRA